MTRLHTTHLGRALPGGARRAAAAFAALGSLAVAGACKDSNVPFFTAPTQISNSPEGIQNSVTGIFSSSRIDFPDFIIEVGAGYSRDGAVFVNTEARTVEYPLGVFPEPNSWANDWAQEYQNIRQSILTLQTIPKVSPAYTAQQAAALTGLVQTLEAYNYMIVLEAHDSLGMDIQAGTPTSALPAAVCMKDGWRYIVALLDSANASLTAAGSTPMSSVIKLPNGFAGVGGAAGPSTVAGSFASFNRALAAKANLELAYAIARTPAGASRPTPATPGAPDATALNAALADLQASALYDPTGAFLVPNTPGGFSADAHTITHDFSAQSGDQVNPVQGNIGLLAQLNDFIADVDTAKDLRWKAKFIVNPVVAGGGAVQQQLYNPVASPFIYGMYINPGSPIPILRDESLTLWGAQIYMGLGNYPQALALVNNVRTKVGGLTAYPASDGLDYVKTRNDLMREQRISTTWEASIDRTIAIRMYGMAIVSDTTWSNPGGGTEDASVKVQDSHTTVEPIPSAELNGRGGSYTTSCTS